MLERKRGGRLSFLALITRMVRRTSAMGKAKEREEVAQLRRCVKFVGIGERKKRSKFKNRVSLPPPSGSTD